jgi:molybdopterin converting factor small subunit
LIFEKGKRKIEESFVDVDEEKKEKKKKKNKKSGDVFEEFIEQYKEQKEKQEKERIKREEHREKLDLMLIGLLQNVVNNSFLSNNNDSMFDNYNHTSNNDNDNK